MMIVKDKPHRTKGEITRADMYIVGELYDFNCDKMIKACASGDEIKHRHYIKRERRLYKLDVKIRKMLGVWDVGYTT
jgi:hypothetical protein